MPTHLVAKIVAQREQPNDNARVIDAVAAVAAVAETGRSQRRVGRIDGALPTCASATALANGLALYTRHPDDLAGLSDLVHVVGI